MDGASNPQAVSCPSQQRTEMPDGAPNIEVGVLEGYVYAYTLPPAIICWVFSSKVTFWPVWIAATFMHSATEWL